MVKSNYKINVLVSGAAGFIGYHISKKLISKKFNVVGIDNLNKYYDLSLKKNRLKNLKNDKFKKNFKFYKIDLNNFKKLENIFKKFKFDYVVNLAAQAGVRYSLKHPKTYLRSNVNGFFNILELSRRFKIKHFVYASSSSIYGKNKETPFKESLATDNPLQIYAATKKTNELFAHVYSNLYKMPTTGLRFFTVYGPWGRPDMAPFLFVKNIHKGRTIKVFNNGNHLRDFTYIDDIIDGISKIIFKVPSTKKNLLPYQILNIGNSNPVKLMDFITQIEKKLVKKSKKIFLPLQKGDVIETHSNISKIKKIINYKPKTNYKSGVSKFINWYLNYNNIKK